MSNKKNDQKQPLQKWLPSVILKILVFGAFAFVLYETLEGLGDQELSSNRLWAVIGGMVGLLLLLAIDRLTGLRVSTEGVEATLAEVKVQALDEISDMEDKDAVNAARKDILRAQTTDQVRAAKAVAVELNANRIIERVTKAIQGKRKCYVRYRPDSEEPAGTYLVAPLDIKPGKTPATRANDYLWVHFYEDGAGTRSLRLGRVLGIELSEETFDPQELATEWKTKPEWNVAREW
jgi:predicted DNA-binding transcriptional regulator YafY